MAEPPQQRDLALLRLDFRERLERWLDAVKAAFPGYQVAVHETLRTKARQEWLYEQGRTRPGPIVTWTLDSNHLYGIAADFHVARDGQAIWDTSVYERIYAAVPPERFGLESLAPTEWVHIQLADADNRRDEKPEPAPEQLLVILAPDNTELARVPIPAGSRVRAISTVDLAAGRVYVRPEITEPN